MIYSGNLSIENNTPETYNVSNGAVIGMKFSFSFNGRKLYPNESMVKQIIKFSPAVKRYFYHEMLEYCKSNKHAINQNILHTCTAKNFPIVELKVIGKYLFVYIYCGVNNSISECLKAFNNRLNHGKDINNVLAGK